ncbi:Coronatine-insensitive [Thalictrum thalictroides]|uniref:Coronatine-insensitive n=1 Tax=Thalictrum thalictroides TaxID=46969 RepID=A0A7J6X1C8_THATH|nr:Coronatine-insensitive [Thalictrum thalictroides]
MAIRNMNRMLSFGISDVALECIMEYIDDPRDRDAMSLVCRLWYEIDARTRKHITIAFCYTTTPDRLRRRFPRLESLKLKGKPRASMFNLIPDDWGGYAGPWINEISVDFKCLKYLHLRRMIVKDKDLEVLVGSRGQTLQALKLDKCSGFSTDGLLHITRSCRCLRTLFLEESSIDDKDGEWLHELALNNTVLETLNFYMTDLNKISIQDLELLAKNCRSLVSIKISEHEILNLKDFFQYTTALEEFAGGTFGELPDKYNTVIFPQTLRRLGPSFIEKDMMFLVYPLAPLLKKLDLLYSLLDTEDHCQLIQRCPNLEVLEARNVIGNRGLEVLAQSCKRLKRLRIERGEDEEGMEDEQGVVSQSGLSSVAQGCVELEYIAIHVSDITNSSLELFGTHCKNLCDFRLVLLDREEHITDLPLDNGVRALLMGCQKLKRFALYVRPGGLTDVGLSYIGQYSNEVRWMLLGYVGESDAGILEFSKGCPNLQKLEMRGCCFTERTLALAVSQLTSLRYLWVQQLRAALRSSDLSPMVRRYWNIELFPYTRCCRTCTDGEERNFELPAQPDQILAYYSLAGQRRDYPSAVVPLNPEHSRS